MKPKAYIQLVVNYKATRTPPKFQIRNKGVFIYYVINIGGRGVSQMLMFVDMGGGGVLMKRLLIMLTWGPPKMWNYKQVQSTNSWYEN